ncbi:hypothetical protein CL1_0314 [Thermococcus cleftensis]|uniref:Uncharacterized protein n=1 Tax=Thermococcus cleftensis (strain DSM 27260 / KACC 17922 / CL1) TaxID=163003 RepID=I3ZS41_THECF|nr:hypothetical protein [Thermococcus cleftensis]AFL94525.1 hypothetical protein CL1_0314 [Thermococcus cleftensis]
MVFIIFLVATTITAKYLVGNPQRQKILLITAPILSLVLSLFAIVAYYPPEQPGILLLEIGATYVIYRIFTRFDQILRWGGTLYRTFEIAIPLLALSTFRTLQLFVVNAAFTVVTLLLLETTRRKLEAKYIPAETILGAWDFKEKRH